MSRRSWSFSRRAAAGLALLSLSAPISAGTLPPTADERLDAAVAAAGVRYTPVLSPPTWVVPSSRLPPGVAVQRANNNLSILFHDGRLYLAWRTAPHHFATADARLQVISSTDLGRTWMTEANVAMGTDLREPCLLVVGRRLFLYFAELGDNPYAFEPTALWRMERGAGGRWSRPVRWGGPGEMAWEFKVRRGRAWMTSYSGKRYGPGRSLVSVRFRSSADGVDWQDVRRPDGVVYRGGVSEAAFEFDLGGRLWAVTRNEDGDETGFGSHLASAPADHPGNWIFPLRANPNRYDSPRMFRHGRDIFLVARRDVGAPFDSGWRMLPTGARKLALWPAYSLRPKRTALYALDVARRGLEPVVDLPSAGDTAFPSVARLDAHTYLIANYTSPLDDPDRSWLAGQVAGTGIYLVTLRFERQGAAVAARR